MSFKYGVSPQPEHAPLNSNVGCSSCTSFTVVVFKPTRSTSGSDKKKSQFLASLSRSGICGCMLMAFKLVLLLFLAGQTATHRVQPVQSSGATCSVYFSSLNSFQRAAVLLNVSGALARYFSSYTLARITECGQTITHLPHWMQTSVSH